MDVSFTLGKLALHRIVVHLQGGIGIRAGKSHHVIPSVTHFGLQVPNGYVFGSKVVVDEQLAPILNKEGLSAYVTLECPKQSKIVFKRSKNVEKMTLLARCRINKILSNLLIILLLNCPEMTNMVL